MWSEDIRFHKHLLNTYYGPRMSPYMLLHFNYKNIRAEEDIDTTSITNIDIDFTKDYNS